ncbi:hypothetical protein [Streptomyces tanashiensis]|uniref:hypothetical protein n=1 Tax=Streptomyces tanashiensis TaxID=67367 RepID=UPI0033E5CCD3
MTRVGMLAPGTDSPPPQVRTTERHSGRYSITETNVGTTPRTSTAFAELAATHRGQPVDEIVPLLRAAAGCALVGFTGADLVQEAEAIRIGARYELQVRVTGWPRKRAILHEARLLIGDIPALSRP